jgi:hypothetical protein
VSGELIAPIVATPRRHLLNVEDDAGGIGAVEVIAAERRIDLYVYTDDDDVCVTLQVKAS